ncbi:MAG: hypothetical protein HY073_01715 [Deltaproteobacteria bacterium]|nr:hypothetical protein [Deltaproteobacteria bacterium]
MKRFLKIVSALVVTVSLQFVFVFFAFADTAGSLYPGLVNGSDGNFVYFSATTQPNGGGSRPPNTCLLAGAYDFKFDATTPKGKIWFALLLSAKMTGKRISVWYTDSSNGANPCADATMAVSTGIQVD